MPDPRLDALATIRERICRENDRLAEERDAGAPGAMQPDGTWADLDYGPGSLKDWDAARHLDRLLAMARAWRHPDSPVHGKPDLQAALLKGLDAWYARNPVNPNWWWNQIGAPLKLAEILLRLKGTCDASYITRAEPAFLCHEPIIRFTGQNLVWTATVQIFHGILTDDPDRATRGFMLVGREIRVLPREEGIQPDMSFFQHGLLLYSGGYGQGFAGDVARLMALAAGTPYALPDCMIDRFARFLLDGSRWMVRGRTFLPVAIGREITRAGHDAGRFRDGLRRLAGVPHARQAETRTAAGADPAAGGSLVEGNRHFWCSDLMCHHRPGYAVSFRLASSRVLNADMACCGGEGRLCHHMADGATMIQRDGAEYRDVYPAWNWRRIPGTTIEQEPGPFDPETMRRFGEQAFAGGASDGRVGCAAMDFSRFSLKARKAWFLFDEGFLALGCGIASGSDAPVLTTLDQCRRRGPVRLAGRAAPLADGVVALEPGSAFTHHGVLYRILDGRGELRLENRTGAWSDCGVGSPDPVTVPFLDAGLDHGIRPSGASYAYAVLPDIKEGQAFPGEMPFAVVRNDPACQAVWHDAKPGGRTSASAANEQQGQAVFFEPGSVRFPDGQELAVDRPCIVLYRPEGNRVRLTLAQPAQEEGLITVRLAGPGAVSAAVSLPVAEYAGSSITLVFQGI